MEYSHLSSPRRQHTLYPGKWVDHSAIISDTALTPVTEAEIQTLSKGLHPLIAIGSNASPSQLRDKFLGSNFNVLTVKAKIPGIIGYANFKAPYGSIPATWVAMEEETAEVRVQFVTDEELDRLDQTEFPHYSRKQLDFVQVEGLGSILAFIYVAAGGHLTDEAGNPVKLAPIHADGLTQVEVLATYPHIVSV